VKILINQTNNHKKQKDNFGFVEGGEHEVQV
jgi:hypothetical protein